MKMLFFPLLVFSIVMQSCQGQSASKEVFSKEFNWTIKIPAGFESVPTEQWKKLQNKGAAAVEKTYDAKAENHATALFVFRSDQFNYFESNHQPFDVKKDGDYLESFRDVSNMLYGTFEAQMPQAKLDTSYFQETISGKQFHGFKVAITFPNKMVMEWLLYSRLFGNKEFTVNIMTVDKEKQKLLLDAWRQSKFK